MQSTSSSRHQFCCLTLGFAVDVSPMCKTFKFPHPTLDPLRMHPEWKITDAATNCSTQSNDLIHGDAVFLQINTREETDRALYAGEREEGGTGTVTPAPHGVRHALRLPQGNRCCVVIQVRSTVTALGDCTSQREFGLCASL